MPDIGLLQGGPPRPRKDATPAARPHFGVVSIADRPLATVSAEPNEPDRVPPPVQQAAPSPSPSPSLLQSPPTPPISVRDLLWLMLALVVIIGTGLGIRDPWPADEPRFASLARDMAQSGEWLFPRVGGDLYQDKPPLFFWLLTICFTLFGGFKGWFLIPSFLAAAGILFMVYDFGRRTVSREAGLAAAVLVLCTVQFVQTTRGAQIDSTLCLFITFSMYAFLRQLLLGHGWHWYLMGGFAAGLGVITKGVGFLPLLLLLPFLLMRKSGRWRGLADIDAGRWAWRYWLAPLAMLTAISLWLLPMIATVDASGSPQLQAYRDEILFKQTVDRYATAWHHVKPWWYLVIEMIPPLWLPWSLLLIWLVPRFKAAFHARNARVWLPLSWVMLVLLFFSLSPGKRGVYIFPALPALALASLPLMESVIAKRGVRTLGFLLGIGFWLAALIVAIAHLADVPFAVRLLSSANFSNAAPLYAFLLSGGLGIAVAWRRAPLLVWPVTLGALALVFSYGVIPAIDGKRSGEDFIKDVLARVQPHEQLGLVAYKEQFLLYLDRPTVNFGHRRWLEGKQEAFDAAAWMRGSERRVLLLPEGELKPCFAAAEAVGRASNSEWYLARVADAGCAAKGQASRAIPYPAQMK